MNEVSTVPQQYRNAGTMRYRHSDRITSAVYRMYPNGDDITDGTRGTVIMVYPESETYIILFDTAKGPHKVADADLG